MQLQKSFCKSVDICSTSCEVSTHNRGKEVQTWLFLVCLFLSQEQCSQFSNSFIAVITDGLTHLKAPPIERALDIVLPRHS